MYENVLLGPEPASPYIQSGATEFVSAIPPILPVLYYELVNKDINEEILPRPPEIAPGRFSPRKLLNPPLLGLADKPASPSSRREMIVADYPMYSPTTRKPPLMMQPHVDTPRPLYATAVSPLVAPRRKKPRAPSPYPQIFRTPCVQEVICRHKSTPRSVNTVCAERNYCPTPIPSKRIQSLTQARTPQIFQSGSPYITNVCSRTPLQKSNSARHQQYYMNPNSYNPMRMEDCGHRRASSCSRANYYEGDNYYFSHY